MLDHKLGIKITMTEKSRSAFAAVREEILAAGRLMSLFATAKDLALLNNDIANRKKQQEQGRENLLALLGVTTPTGLDEGQLEG